MFAQFRYLDGPKNGEVKVVGNDFATIGRDPAADVRFDPEQDIEVSIRHAAVFKQGGGFLIRDLGSTNGTFLNGTRVRGDRPLEVGDVIQLGPSGPKIEFGAATTPPHAARAAGNDPHTAGRAAPSEIYRPKPRPTGRAGQPKPRRQTGWRWLVAAIVIAGAGVGAAVAHRAREAAAAALATQRTTLQSRIDEFQARLDQATSPIAGLSAAIAAAKAETGDLRAAVAAMTGPGLDSAATRLDALAARHQPLLAATGFDPATLRPVAAGRVAAVIGEFDRGRVATATSFVVRRAGDTVWLATDRLVAIDSDGRPAGRFAVVFDGARVALLGRLVRTDDTASVAILAVIRSDPPAAVTPGEAPAPGTPVAQVGFPFGADSLGAWRQSGATLSASLATLTTAAPTAVGLETYGGRIWPGSPVVTGAGAVIGMATSGPGGVRVVPIAGIMKLVAPR